MNRVSAPLLAPWPRSDSAWAGQPLRGEPWQEVRLPAPGVAVAAVDEQQRRLARRARGQPRADFEHQGQIRNQWQWQEVATARRCAGVRRGAARAATAIVHDRGARRTLPVEFRHESPHMRAAPSMARPDVRDPRLLPDA